MVDLDENWEITDEDQGASLLALGLNYHLTPGRRADWFIGLFGGLVDFDDTTYNALGEAFNFDYDDGEFGYGLNAGVDVPFGAESSWVLTGGLRYLLATAEEQSGASELDVDPVIFSIGIGYRF